MAAALLSPTFAGAQDPGIPAGGLWSYSRSYAVRGAPMRFEISADGKLVVAFNLGLGLRVSTDGGATWRTDPTFTEVTGTRPAPRLGDAWAPIKSRENFFCRLFGEVWFSPAGRLALANGFATGLCFSRDGGRTWQFWWGREFDGLSRLLADGTLIAVREGGFWLSRDFGLSAEVRHVPDVAGFAMHADGRRGIAVGEKGHVYLTEDRWASLRTIGGVSSQKGIGAAMAPDGKTLVAVFAEYWMLTGTIALSRDFGQTWTTADLPRNAASASSARTAFGETGVLLQVEENLLYSADGGVRWWPLALAGSAPATLFAFDENLRTLLVRDAEGLLLVQPAAGPRWNAERVLAKPDIQSAAVSADGRVGAAVTESGEVLFSRDFGRTWAPAGATVPNATAVSLSPDGTKAIVAVNVQKEGEAPAYISVGR